MEALKYFAKMKDSYYGSYVHKDARTEWGAIYYGLRAMNTYTKFVLVSVLDVKEELGTVLPPTENNNNNNFIRKPIQREYFIN